MAVDIKDLPPEYRAQALRKLMEREKLSTPPSPACEPKKVSKYHNHKTKRLSESGAVLCFDSQKEARRYDELIALLRAGKIQDLRMQVDFTLQEAYTDSEGRRVRAIRYRADFTYRTQDEGSPWVRYVVEDVKSRATRTKEYLIKRKLMKERFGINIQEI